MFTGIIKELGKVKEIKKLNDKSIFKIECKKTIENQEIGASIAVNGTCTTITKLSEKSFTMEAIKETLELTNLSQINEGDYVNLEPALKLNQGLDGHMVLGHVDCLGKITQLAKENDRTILKIKFPLKIAHNLALKGSITINGISLTISKLERETFNVDLIDHTLKATNLQYLKTEDNVNLEIDLISRYLARLLETKEKESTYEFLQSRGFL